MKQVFIILMISVIGWVAIAYAGNKSEPWILDNPTYSLSANQIEFLNMLMRREQDTVDMAEAIKGCSHCNVPISESGMSSRDAIYWDPVEHEAYHQKLLKEYREAKGVTITAGGLDTTAVDAVLSETE